MNILNRIEVYFDNPLCKKLLDPLEISEIYWYLNGKKIKQSQKYTLRKQKEISILIINRINQDDAGLYSIQLVGKNHQHVAYLNIDGIVFLEIIYLKCF